MTTNFEKNIYKSFNFVYLDEIEPSIVVDLFAIRLDNFLKFPLVGYRDNRCLLTYEAATALKKVQHDLLKEDLSLKLYDGYRPQRAVQDLIKQIENCDDTITHEQYFPRFNVEQLIRNNYISSSKSSHSR